MLKNKKGVLRKEVDITVRKIAIATNSILSADGKATLNEANDIAEAIFGGRHGLTEHGYLVHLPMDKQKLPHPVESLVLNVDEDGAGADLLVLNKIAQRVLRKRHSFLSLHLHNLSEGYMVNVEIDHLGIRLF